MVSPVSQLQFFVMRTLALCLLVLFAAAVCAKSKALCEQTEYGQICINGEGGAEFVLDDDIHAA